MLENLLIALFIEFVKGMGEIKNLDPFYLTVAAVCFTHWFIQMVGMFTLVRWFDRLIFRRRPRPTRPVVTRIRPVKPATMPKSEIKK